MDIVTFVGLIGLPAILSTTIPFLITRHFSKKDKNAEKMDETSKRINRIERNYNDLNTQYQTDMDSLGDSLNKINDTLDVLKNAQRALLSDRIVQMYNHHYTIKGYMPIYDRDSLSRMHKEYHNLDGNGVMDVLVDKMESLPTDKE